MNQKLKKLSFIIWIATEILCAFLFIIFNHNKANLFEIIKTIFSLMLMTGLAALVIKAQIKHTWLRASERLGKFTSMFWIVGSSLFFIRIFIDVLSKKFEEIIIIPLFVAIFFVSFNWTKHMQEYSPADYKKQQAESKKTRDKNKIVI